MKLTWRERRRRWRDLPSPEGRLLIVSVLLIPVSAAGLRLLGFGRYSRWMGVLARRGRGQQLGSAAWVRHCVRAVDMASRHGFYAGNCLSKSLTLWSLLIWRAVPAELRIGARKREGRIEAHAWVEVGGLPINDAASVKADFQALLSLPTGAIFPPAGRES